jgi:hypothetical protein
MVRRTTASPVGRTEGNGNEVEETRRSWRRATNRRPKAEPRMVPVEVEIRFQVSAQSGFIFHFSLYRVDKTCPMPDRLSFCLANGFPPGAGK